MHPDFEKTMNAFMAQVKERLDDHNAVLSEYERVFAQIQQGFPSYIQFAEQVANSLGAVQNAFLETEKSIRQELAAEYEARTRNHSVDPSDLGEKIRNELAAEYNSSLQEAKNRIMELEKQLREQPAPSVSISSTDKEKKSAPKKAPVLSTSLPQKKILIVDDAEINRILIGHFFKNMPVKLEFAGSGEQAIEKAGQNSFDLILMDLQMKGMSGIEAIRSIRAAYPQNSKNTQMVAISNQAPSDTEKSDAMEAGANEYLSRSMSRDALRERVFECLLGSEQVSA